MNCGYDVVKIEKNPGIITSASGRIRTSSPMTAPGLFLSHSVISALRSETKLRRRSMGIPSYFKRLTDTVRGLLSPSIQGKVSCLLVDFNCIVYGCLRSDTLPPYMATDDEARMTWERNLNEEVSRYLVRIWEAAGRPASVFIAVDGVVPMAKIKQQRMRRFKSVWWAEKEYEMGARKPGPRWDTNAITPGTEYMDRLGIRLQELCSARGWTVSTSNEPGEGEHKVMEWVRRNGSSIDSNVVVYGLDADLILLSMLTGVEHLTVPIFLMREKAEFGKAAKGTSAPFLFFSTGHLLKNLCPVAEEASFLLDYVAVMSLLGNDFLPHGLTLKIRDGGHDLLLGYMRQIRADGLCFVDYTTKLVNYDVFRRLFEMLALIEEANLLTAIYNKKSMRPMAPRNDTERLMMSVQNLPVEWFVEKEFLDRGILAKNWKDIYARHTPEEAIPEYLYGIQWIVDYYSGKPVDTMWFYPWHLPPLWADLVSATPSIKKGDNYIKPLEPQEQLSLVLPMDSWHLLRDRKLRRAPVLLPQFWPIRFGFISLGKSWMWECEADIPILLPGRLRSLA